MIKEEKNIDFYTTGRQLSEQEFTKISEWIKKDKAKTKRGLGKTRTLRKRSSTPNKSIAASGGDTVQHQQ
ncbi:MAG: hypothetical protein M9904_16415 [Chitinophagaceae bacterium]|nr:hypothetical protein [Chitinophagaceae bacterium]